MIYSDTVRYALMALAYLALHRDRLVKAEEIAKTQGIPKPFLSKILHELAKKEVVQSVKGPKGGFTLRVSPEKLSMWDVVVLMGEENKFHSCILMPEKCEVYEINPCVIHHKWEKLKKKIVDFLQSTTVADLVSVEERHTQNTSSPPKRC
ncbi:MAG TPA: Rrf2 family transcriptional regulator [Aquifex aeolicus]|nr:Rrf2 family transcriptional regulator [Aquifex aeolicus]